MQERRIKNFSLISPENGIRHFKSYLMGKNKKNLFNSSSAETAHRVVNDNSQMSVRKKMCSKMILFLNNGFITPFSSQSSLVHVKLVHVK